MQVFGLSSATLEDYVTSEKDLQRRITNMPTADFLLSKRESMVLSQAQIDDNDEWGDDEDLYDDFVILERPNFDKYNGKDALQKEKDTKNQGDS